MPISWRKYSVRAQIAGSFARRPNSRVKICMRIRPGDFEHVDDSPSDAAVSSLHFSRPTRFASLPLSPLSPVGRSSAPAGKFSSALFINTDSTSHLSRIARGSFSSLSVNNRLVEPLRGPLSRLQEVDHHRLSCHESLGCTRDPPGVLGISATLSHMRI